MLSCITIPAYEPDENLVSYVNSLVETEIGSILVVDDGSSEKCQPIFARLEQIKNCTVLHHDVNRGKGAAIKTAIKWYIQHEDTLYKDYCGLVTVDCDGQHSIKDVIKVTQAMNLYPDDLILGSRDFGEGTPSRSTFGNKLTSFAMNLLYNIKLKDTQTGLRGIPNSLMEEAYNLRGNRYEYELNMLLWINKTNKKFVLVPIETIYFDNNSGSHYRIIRDSLRIIGVLLVGLAQYGLSSTVSALTDVGIYALLVKIILLPTPLTKRIFYAVVIARVLSSVVNYFCNRSLPYMLNKGISTFFKYYVLWFFQLLASFGGVWLFATYIHIDEFIAKLMVDIMLALISYQIQLRWVFRESKKNRPHSQVIKVDFDNKEEAILDDQSVQTAD